MEFRHCVDRVAEMFEGVMRPKTPTSPSPNGQRALRSAAIRPPEGTLFEPKCERSLSRK